MSYRYISDITKHLYFKTEGRGHFFSIHYQNLVRGIIQNACFIYKPLSNKNKFLKLLREHVDITPSVKTKATFCKLSLMI